MTLTKEPQILGLIGYTPSHREALKVTGYCEETGNVSCWLNDKGINPARKRWNEERDKCYVYIEGQ